MRKASVRAERYAGSGKGVIAWIWVKRMNGAIDELEDRLLEPIDYALLARKA